MNTLINWIIRLRRRRNRWDLSPSTEGVSMRLRGSEIILRQGLNKVRLSLADYQRLEHIRQTFCGAAK